MKYSELYTPEKIDGLAEVGMDVPAEDEFTCHFCADKDSCEFAWDLYNTDGDCIADK